MFAALQDLARQEVQRRAEEVRGKIAEGVGQAILHVESTDLYKKHVEFDEVNFFELSEEEEEEEAGADGEEEKEGDVQQQHQHEPPLGRITVSSLALAELNLGPRGERKVFVEMKLSGGGGGEEEEEGETTKRTVSRPQQQPQLHCLRFYGHDDEEEDTMFELPVYDLAAHATLRLRVWAECSMGRADELLGQVLVPVHTLLPPPSVLPARRRQSTTNKLVYRLFPLDATKAQFERCQMTKPQHEPGYLQCHLALELNQSVWRTYMSSSTKKKHKKRERPRSARSNMAAGMETAQTLRKLAKLQHRFAALARRLVFGPFAPTAALAKARSRTSPVFSIVFGACTLAALLFLDARLLLVYAWLVLIVGVCLRKREKEAAPAEDSGGVWKVKAGREEGMNPLQQAALLLWVSNRALANLARAADVVERIVNALEFTDTRASALLVGAGGLASAVVGGVVLGSLPARWWLAVAFVAWMLAPVDFEELTRRGVKRVVRSQRGGAAVKAVKATEAQKKAPSWMVSSLRNVAGKVPNMDQVEHAHICAQQVVRDSAKCAELFE